MNSVILIGRLTKDPAYTNSGTAVAKYILAVDRPYKKDGQQETDFISCVAFGKSADFVRDYLHKGMKMAVEGRITTGSYENKDGVRVYTTDVIVDRHEFCEKASSQPTPEPAPISGNYVAAGFAPVPDAVNDDTLPFA